MFDTSELNNLALNVFGFIPSFLSSADVTLCIGTKKPMIRLIIKLTAKLRRKSGIVKCPELSVPVSDRNKLSVTPISRLISIDTFFIL